MGTKELLIILVVVLIVFGAKKLRSVGEDLGHAVSGFKKAMEEGEQKETAAPLAHWVVPDADDTEPPTSKATPKAEAAAESERSG